MTEIKPLEIKIKYHADIDRIEKIPMGDWIDLRTAEDIRLERWESAQISLGVSMKLPYGFEAHILPRSSTFKRYGLLLTNGMGIIDNSYSGTNDVWHFPAFATRMVFIPRNTRICQFRIVPVQPIVSFTEVEALDKVDRGGFGSTGV